MVSLTWSEIRQVLVEDYELYQALYDVYVNYIEELIEYASPYDYSEFIIDWLEDNLKDYKEEFLSMLSLETSFDCNTDGEIDNDNITELLDDEEFMKEFRQYLCD